jgi:peptidoglycan/xylan/chitin deacetylase (PgdA/CDA1 family)
MPPHCFTHETVLQDTCPGAQRYVCCGAPQPLQVVITTAVRRASLSLSSHLGLTDRLASSLWRRQRLLVLCYHGISLSDEHRWHPHLYLSQTVLSARLEMLRRHHCTVLPLGEAVERVARKDLPDRAVVITFDDGYYDFRARAFPLLREYGYPVTVYLTTMRCEHNYPIVHLLLSYVLWRCRDGTLDGRGLPGLGHGCYPLGTAKQRAAVVAAVDAESRRAKLSRTQKDQGLAQISERLGFRYDDLVASRILTLMNPAEVAEMAGAGVAIELHTHGHRTPEDPELFRREILENRSRIEAMTGRRPIHFCYPSGCYRPAYLPVLASEGVVSATTCEPGLVTSVSNPLLWPRFVDTMGVRAGDFEAWLSGTAALVARPPAAVAL